MVLRGVAADLLVPLLTPPPSGGAGFPAARGGAAPHTRLGGQRSPSHPDADGAEGAGPALSPAPAGRAVRSREPPRGWMRAERRRRRGRAGRAGLRRQPRALGGRPAPLRGAPAKVRAGAGTALFSSRRGLTGGRGPLRTRQRGRCGGLPRGGGGRGAAGFPPGCDSAAAGEGSGAATPTRERPRGAGGSHPPAALPALPAGFKFGVRRSEGPPRKAKLGALGED